MTSAVQRDAAALAQRKADLLLGSELVRVQMAGAVAELEPGADRLVHWTALALCVGGGLRVRATTLRRVPWPRHGGAVGAAGLGWLVFRRRRWLRRAFLAWRVWRLLRRGL